MSPRDGFSFWRGNKMHPSKTRKPAVNDKPAEYISSLKDKITTQAHILVSEVLPQKCLYLSSILEVPKNPEKIQKIFFSIFKSTKDRWRSSSWPIKYSSINLIYVTWKWEKTESWRCCNSSSWSEKYYRSSIKSNLNSTFNKSQKRIPRICRHPKHNQILDNCTKKKKS